MFYFKKKKKLAHAYYKVFWRENAIHINRCYLQNQRNMAHVYLKRPFFLPGFSAGKFHIFKQPVTKKKNFKLFQNCEMIFFYGWLQSLILANKSRLDCASSICFVPLNKCCLSNGAQPFMSGLYLKHQGYSPVSLQENKSIHNKPTNAMDLKPHFFKR